MKNDLKQRLTELSKGHAKIGARALLDRVAVDLASGRAETRALGRRIGPLRASAVFAAAAAVTAIVVGVSAFIALQGEESAPVVSEPPATTLPTATTIPPVTTSLPSTTLPTATTTPEPSPTAIEPTPVAMTWTRLSGESTPEFNDLLVHDSGFVAVGAVSDGYYFDAAVWLSDDMTTWAEVPDPDGVFRGTPSQFGTDGPQYIDFVIEVRQGLLASGQDCIGGWENCSNVLWFSEDGSRWERLEVSGLPERGAAFLQKGGYINSIVSGGPGLIAIGGIEGVPTLWLSENMTEWTQINDPDLDTGEPAVINGVAAGGPGLVAVGSTGVGSEDLRPAVWVSPDGIDWERVPDDIEAGPDAPLQVGALHPSRVAMTGVAAGPGGLVAFGPDGWEAAAGPMGGTRATAAAVWTSPDGWNWTRVTSAAFEGSSMSPEDAIWDGDRVLIVGRDLYYPSPADIVSVAVVLASADGGETWVRIGEGDSLFGSFLSDRGAASMYRLFPHDAGFIAVGNHDGDPAVWYGTWNEDGDGAFGIRASAERSRLDMRGRHRHGAVWIPGDWVSEAGHYIVAAIPPLHRPDGHSQGSSTLEGRIGRMSEVSHVQGARTWPSVG